MALSRHVKQRIRRNKNRRYVQRILKTRDPKVIADFMTRNIVFGEAYYPTVVITPDEIGYFS